MRIVRRLQLSKRSPEIGADIPWLGLFSFPILLQKGQALRAAGSWAHFLFAWSIAVLAAHLGGGVWPVAIRRGSVLTRLWPSYRPAPSSRRS
jgi:cytochrome b561